VNYLHKLKEVLTPQQMQLFELLGPLLPVRRGDLSIGPAKGHPGFHLPARKPTSSRIKRKILMQRLNCLKPVQTMHSWRTP
jgi:hypothetical protein